MSKEHETGLTVRSKELGKGLIAEAQKENRDNVKKVAVGFVQGLLVQLQKQRDYRLNVEQNIAHLEAQLKAVEGGAFEADTRGLLTFTDATLNRPIEGMVECFNCGANAGRPRR